MLYSIGYGKMSRIEELIDALEEKGVQVVLDVRSRPGSRKPCFAKANLQKSLEDAGFAYIFAGKILGGFMGIQEAAIKNLADFQKDKVACLLCAEADPDRCHRKTEIGRRLMVYGVNVEHILT